MLRWVSPFKTSIQNQHSFGFTKLFAGLMKNAVLSDRYNYRVKIINDIVVVMRTFACQLAAIRVGLVHGMLLTGGEYKKMDYVYMSVLR